MRIVINKKLPQRQMIQKIKGRTFHLPLPLQETLSKLCKNTDPINMNHEMYILVRSIPTKSKIIWEEIVSVIKVFDALTWLKHNNPFYNCIVLPGIHDGLCLEKLNNPKFETNKKSVSNDDHQMQETENNIEAIVNEVNVN